MDGVILLNKPKGMTSHDCVGRIRRILKTKKVGHTGTLDPDAEGVLPICVGKATKISSLLSGQTKEYIAEISLGQATTTEDHSGEVIETATVNKDFSVEDVRTVLDHFVGTINQIPPMYSAIKVNGKKLYEYAREGLEVDRPVRQIEIHSINMLSNDINCYNEHDARFKFSVMCSSGTYVRTLCVDIGKQLGYPAHMSDLKRTKVGQFEIDDTVTFDEFEEAVNQNTAPVISMANALNLPYISVNDEDAIRYKHGQVLSYPKDIDDSLYKILDSKGQLIAIYQPHPSKEGMAKPFRVFH
ncbi:tRNA pseudouridine(55) synthase TruB [Piscibacillus sp. B03]|uniref:tRNA pseudouridine(55) synthase TruB n=1 Tax=Piscibacillus sp. B03 TaxID=3457430 RepID=UPI003FCD523A